MLTPEEIEARDFLISLRGYDREEVHDFLGQVADRVRELQDRVEELETDAAVSAQRAAAAQETAELTIPQPAAEPPAPAADTSALFAEIGRETQRILEAAQEAAEQIRGRAGDDAERELQTAREQAAELLADGERRLEETRRAVARLKDARSALAGDLLSVGRTIDQLLRELGPDGEESQPATGVETSVAEARGEQADAADT
ncbi:MAG TPA: DivIVA domain-containing protein, partial [Egibacteraceae bacterium]|nr:DivIVA domain-containing protein [Egibacteraceae bacterium]